MNAPYTLLQGTALARLRKIPDASVDSIVTDPPYELGFMDKHWDRTGIAYSRALWRHSLRVLKPGGHVLAFGSTRTYHRLACAIESAGFEVRDQLAWVYGSGMPKSRDLGDGWGTALKPAWEPIVMARKPFRGTTAECREANGTGGIHVDACLIPLGGETLREGAGATWESIHAHEGRTDADTYRRNCPGDRGHGATRKRGTTDLSQGGGRAREGRWPANLMHDGSDEVLSHFPTEAGGKAPVTGREPSCASTGNVTNLRQRVATDFIGDAGSAARFFYCAKATRAEREAGLEELETKSTGRSNGAHAGRGDAFNGMRERHNHHPTVKPIAVMRWLQRLVTPPGGVTLDGFAGSGTSGVAAILEGFHPIMIELDRDADRKPLGYIDIIRGRCAWAIAERERELQTATEAARVADFHARQLSFLEA